jgi:uncharacterized membrane protein YtjA (UPF0391 family)
MEAARTPALLQRTGRLTLAFHREEDAMLYYALVFLVFLVVGVIAAALNLAGVSAVAVQIPWILFLIGIVLVAIHVVTGRTARVP